SGKGQEVVRCDNIPARNITCQVIGGISQPEVVVQPVASSVSDHSEDRKSHLPLELKEGNEEGSEEDDDEAEEGETDGTNEADGSDDYESGTSEEVDDDEDIEGGGEADTENSVCTANKEDNQVYTEVDRFGEELVKNPEESLPTLLVIINGLFSKLEASIGHFHAMHQIDSSVDSSYSFPLMFDKLPEVNQEGSQWTDCEIRDAINLIYENLHKLDSYLSVPKDVFMKLKRIG
ncbi:hypothetical protein U1Q18_001143, partial [Sarracenia purpurea var. burkii]